MSRSKEHTLFLQYALVLLFFFIALDLVIAGIHPFFGPQNWPSWQSVLQFFLFRILPWELVLVLALSYLFYRQLLNYKKYKEDAREYQRLLLQAVSHKMGNFLAAQRMDMELLKQKDSAYLLDRIERAYTFMERDFRHVLKVLQEFDFEEPEAEQLDLSEVAGEVLGQLREDFSCPLSCRLQKAPVQGRRAEMETLVYILMENAAKYCSGCARIRTGQAKGGAYLYICNDTGRDQPKGSGLGLSIARKLCQRNGLTIRHKETSNRFAVLIGQEAKGRLFTIFSRA